jgi:hypothetical protein
MSYKNKDELRLLKGKVGIFYNYGNEKALVIGKLNSVTANGKCENEDDVYFDEFEPKSKEQLLKLVYLLFK